MTKGERAERAERIDRELVNLGVYASLERRILNEVYALRWWSSPWKRSELFHRLQMAQATRAELAIIIRDGKEPRERIRSVP